MEQNAAPTQHLERTPTNLLLGGNRETDTKMAGKGEKKKRKKKEKKKETASKQIILPYHAITNRWIGKNITIRSLKMLFRSHRSGGNKIKLR